MTAFAREAVNAVSDIQQALADGRFASLDRVWNAVVQRIPGAQRADVAAAAADAARQSAMFLAAQLGVVARNTAGFLVDLVLSLFAAFFLLRDSNQIVTLIRRLLPMDEPTREQLIVNTRELVSISVTSSGIVAAVQGLLGGLVFYAVGIDAPVFWGVVMAFFCLLPFGAWVIWGPAAILLAASGQVGRAIIVAGLGVGIVSAVDNVLRPMLLSGRTSLNGLAIFISLLGGMAAFGAVGLVLGPLVIGTAAALLKTYADQLPGTRRLRAVSDE
jgi:predicted PurR-regulated permease PerM